MINDQEDTCYLTASQAPATTFPHINFSKLKCDEHIRIFLILKVNIYVSCLYLVTAIVDVLEKR